MLIAVTLPCGKFLMEQMDFQLPGNLAGFGSRECLVQGGDSMGIEVVHDKDDLVTVRIPDIDKIPDSLCPVNCSAVFTHTYMAYASQKIGRAHV